MKRNFLKGAAFAALALAGFTATAQEESTESTFDLSGSVDAYFRANLNGRNGASNVAPTTSFADKDGFSVGMVNLIASKQIGKVGFVADIAFGPKADAAALDNVNQLFVSYAVSEATTLTFGRFNTFLGYEVISPTGNFNYSTSYMFTNGPFSHTGIKADFSLSEEFSLAAAVMNSTDAGFENVNGKYTAGLQLGYALDNGSAYLNFLYGRNGFSPEETFQVDLTTGWDLTDEFYLGANASYQDTDGSGFYGVALYPQYALSESFTLGLRAEYFATNEGFGISEGEEIIDFVDNGNGGFDRVVTPGDFSSIIGFDNEGEGSVFATTLTGSYTQGALTIKPELRLDAMSEDFFTDSDGDVEKSLASFVLGAIYAF